MTIKMLKEILKLLIESRGIVTANIGNVAGSNLMPSSVVAPDSEL